MTDEVEIFKSQIASLENRLKRLTRVIMIGSLFVVALLVIAWNNQQISKQVYFGEFWATSEDASISHEGKFSTNSVSVNLTLGQPGGDKSTGYYVVPGLDMGYSAKQNVSYIALYDANQNARLYLGVTETGDPLIQMLNAAGEVIWSAPR